MTINDVSALDEQAQGSDVSGDVVQQNAEQQITTEQAAPVPDQSATQAEPEETPEQIIESLYAKLEKTQHSLSSNHGRVSKLTKELEEVRREREELKARLDELTAPKIDLTALEQDYPDMAAPIKALTEKVKNLEAARQEKPEPVVSTLDDEEFERRKQALAVNHPDYLMYNSTNQDFVRFVKTSYGQDGLNALFASVDPNEISSVLTEYKEARRLQNQISTLRQRQLAATAPAPAQKSEFRQVQYLSELDLSKLTPDEYAHYAALYEQGKIKL